MQGRRLSVAAVAVVLGALVFTTGAQACSCVPQGPVEALRRSDAAIVASLVEVMPHGGMRADYRYRVRRVYRGARMLGRGETISVRSARDAAACGLPRHQEQPIGLFLSRDPRGRWTAGICSTIAPRRLGQAAKRGAGERAAFPREQIVLVDCHSDLDYCAPAMAQQAPSDSTPFSIDPSDELPVGLQLTWRLRALIATGRLASGERLPSFRRLSGWAGVNVNTVRAVYAGLEQEGLVVSRQGQGTFVAEGIEPAAQLEEIATDALRRAHDAGLSPRQLAIVASACASMPGGLDDVPATAASELPDLAEEGEAIEVRHELRRQIARLEAELATYPRDLPRDLPTAPRRASAHVARVEELEQTRDTLIAQLSEAQRAAEQRARQVGRERVQDASPLERATSWWRHKL